MALAADFLELVSDYKADLFALSESWLKADDTAAKLEIIPSGYKLMNHPRIRHRGGGVALVYKEFISLAMSKHSDNSSSSFEFSELSVRFGSFAAQHFIVYHPPCTKSFVSEFRSYL